MAPSPPTRRLLPLSTFTAHYIHITARGLRDLYAQAAAPPKKEKKSKGKGKRPPFPTNDDELREQAFRIDETLLHKKNGEDKYTSLKRDFQTIMTDGVGSSVAFLKYVSFAIVCLKFGSI